MWGYFSYQLLRYDMCWANGQDMITSTVPITVSYLIAPLRHIVLHRYRAISRGNFRFSVSWLPVSYVASSIVLRGMIITPSPGLCTTMHWPSPLARRPVIRNPLQACSRANIKWTGKLNKAARRTIASMWRYIWCPRHTMGQTKKFLRPLLTSSAIDFHSMRAWSLASELTFSHAAQLRLLQQLSRGWHRCSVCDIIVFSKMPCFNRTYH
jgi:hypothetical protein